MRWPFMSRANPLCGRYGRFAARPHCQPGSGYRRCKAWPNDSDLSEYRRTSPVGQRLYALGESCTLWALTRAFNSAAVSRQPFLRDHHELWISRAELLGRYGRPRRSSGTNRPDELIAGSADDFAGGQLAK